MKIEILGSGCPRCKMLESNVVDAVKRSGKKAEIVKITKYEDIVSYGVMSTPALVIDGRIVSQGRIPSSDEILKML
ncbi:MAG: thioredoxin family protein [Candidatus Bilamarchaeaceae archaeon]